MKFKIIFISFNILIVFSFLMIFLLPVFMLGGEYSALFWQESWYIAVIFFCILIFINIVYFINRKILTCLENENWSELKSILEEKLFVRKNLLKMYVRMYISTCIAVSSLNDIGRLEELIRREKPGSLGYWALPLGLPHLLGNNPEDMKTYFGEFVKSKARDKGWICWNYCFALLLLKENDEAVEMLKTLEASEKDPVLKLMTLYMLKPFGNDDEIDNIIKNGCTELRSRMPEPVLKKEMEKQRDNVQMLFLSKIIGEASIWLYNGEENENIQ